MKGAMNFAITRNGLQKSLSAAGIFAIIVFSGPCAADETAQFEREFIQNYEQQNFNAQVKLVLKNKDLVAATITELTRQALDKKNNFDEKMRLLNIASAMAYMHSHWNHDGKPLETLDPIIERELKKDQIRRKKQMEGRKNEHHE